MGKFITIGERIHCISPVIRAAMAERNPEPILKRAEEQLAAGADYLDVNIGPAESDGEELMKWAVTTIQSRFDNVPLALDTANKAAIIAGMSVYNRSKGKPIVNSADAGDRLSYIDIAAEGDGIVIALCSKAGVPADVDERMGYLMEMLEYGMGLGLEPDDMWFDPLMVVAKGMQDKLCDVLETLHQFKEQGFKSTCGLSNVSNGMPKAIRPIMDSAMMAMCMEAGLTSAIVNPCDQRLMETIKSCDIINNNTLYADSYLDL